MSISSDMNTPQQHVQQYHVFSTETLARLKCEINHCLEKTATKEDIFLEGLEEGSCIRIKTRNHQYILEVRNRQVWISGHPKYCPQPVQVSHCGSSWGGSMLKLSYIGVGMYLEFRHPQFTTVTTSRIVSIEHFS